jgi:hypothetical protein
MMGRNDKPQRPLLYTFNLDDLVPRDYLLRKIDRFLDLSKLHQHLAPYCKTYHTALGRYRDDGDTVDQDDDRTA